jgi:Tol biopolymer transport system component
LDRVIQRCLAKEPESRWQTANDLAVELRWVEETPAPAAELAVQAEKSTSTITRKLRVWMATAGIFLAIAIALGLILMLADRVPAPETVRFSISAPGALSGLSVSPDGRRVVLSVMDAAGVASLWVRPLDSLVAQPLPGTQGAGITFWSPDSRWIAFFAQGALKKIDASGGPPQILCDAPNGRGGSWNSEGLIIFAPDVNAPLSRVSAAGGATTPLTKLTATQSGHRYPAFLPDGKHFIYTAVPPGGLAGTAGTAEILLGNLESGDTSLLLRADSPALFSPTGYLLFARQGALVAQQFDTKKFRVVGEAVPVAQQVLSNANLVAASVSASGTLIFDSGTNIQEFQLAWVDRTGKVVDSVGPVGPYRGVDLSPDGKRIAVHRHEGTGGDVWLAEAQGPVRLTFDPSQDNSNPIWSPDGKRIAFGSRRGGKWGIYEKPTDGTGKEELLLELGSTGGPMSWSTDGKFLAYTTVGPQTNLDIWAVALTGERKPFTVVEDQGLQTMPQISPDGKWIAYVSNVTGRFEVYVRPFPTGDGHWQITTDGALNTSMRWRGDGKELFYMALGANVPVMAVPINAGGTFQWGTPRKLFDSHYPVVLNVGHTYHDFSVSRDGQRFLIPQANRGAAQTPATPQITVVLNWTAALNKK